MLPGTQAAWPHPPHRRLWSCSRAADALFLSQSAVSQRIAALEAEAGDRLFTRAPRQMIPTEHGKRLYAEVVQGVDALERVARRRAHRADPPVVRLGAPQEFFHEVLLDSLDATSVRFWLTFGNARDLLEGLKCNELDLVVATQRLSSAAVAFEKLADERFILVSAASHSRPEFEARQAPAGHAVSWLKDQRWISYGNELPIIRRLWQQEFGRRPDIRPSLVIPDLRCILRAVERGHGIALLPEYLCRDALNAGLIHQPWTPTRPVMNEIWLAYRNLDRADDALQGVCAQLMAAAAAQWASRPSV